MAETTKEQKALAEEEAKKAAERGSKEQEQSLKGTGSAFGDAEKVAGEGPEPGHKKHVELASLGAASPTEAVSNLLEEGKGYYVGGKLVDPNGDLIR